MRKGVPFVDGSIYPKTDRFNTKDIDFTSKDTYKCCRCGFEAVIQPAPWNQQSECPECKGQMMSWLWGGWKKNSLRDRHWKASQELRDIESQLTVSQAGLPILLFTRSERTIGNGVMVVEDIPCEAPWMGALGACKVKIYAMRRRGDLVEFGVGNEEPPIISWISANDFANEWSK